MRQLIILLVACGSADRPPIRNAPPASDANLLVLDDGTCHDLDHCPKRTACHADCRDTEPMLCDELCDRACPVVSCGSRARPIPPVSHVVRLDDGTCYDPAHCATLDACLEHCKHGGPMGCEPSCERDCPPVQCP